MNHFDFSEGWRPGGKYPLLPAFMVVDQIMTIHTTVSDFMLFLTFL